MREEQRESWGSRPAFVLAAIGSAVGLGNLWGFPYKLYSHGGGAFLIPYVIAMLLIGLPLLIAEFSLGHLTQRATPEAFGRANRRFAFVGWWQIILSFVIITYYAVILAWCLSFLYYSVVGIFQGALPWAGEGVEGVEKAKDFFFKDYLGKTEGFSLGSIRWHIVGALLLTWTAMYFCIFRGVKMVSKVVMWTVPLPWLMLLILTIRGLTLEGAVQGLEYYLEPNWDRLANPETWRWAFGQMFFSMSLAFGVMITYASFLHRKSDLNNNAAIIGLADLGTSFMAGLAVFATLGGMAFASSMAGNAVPVEKVVESGPSLAFVAFPYALAQLPYAAWFSLVFFSSLLLLGIDSAFSITESVLASIVDKTGWNRGKTLIALSVVGLLIGLVFCTQGGLGWLGTFDGFINGTWGITLTALLECLVLGWLFRLRRLRDHANERSDWKIGWWWDWSIRLVIPVVLAALFAWSLFDSLSDPAGYVFTYESKEITSELGQVTSESSRTGTNVGNVVGLCLMAVAPILAIIIASVRMRGSKNNNQIEEAQSQQVRAGKASGVLAILLAGLGLVLLGVAFGRMLSLSAQIRVGGDIGQPAIVQYLGLGILAGAMALLLGGWRVLRSENSGAEPAMASRLGSGLAVLILGLGAGLSLALVMLGKSFPDKPIVYDNQLSGVSYLILGGMLGLIVVGLCLCFYRAIKARDVTEG